MEGRATQSSIYAKTKAQCNDGWSIVDTVLCGHGTALGAVGTMKRKGKMQGRGIIRLVIALSQGTFKIYFVGRYLKRDGL